MSTICKLATTAPSQAVRSAVEAFFHARDLPFEVRDSEWPLANEPEQFLISRAFPSLFSLGQVTPDVAELHFNSFSELQDLASSLSSATGNAVVVNIYQSVSTASYWALHRDGRLIRSVEAGDGEIVSQAGSPLPFEGSVVEPGFDADTQDWYNREAGVPVGVYQQYDAGWINFIVPKRESTTKPWWRFW